MAIEGTVGVGLGGEVRKRFGWDGIAVLEGEGESCGARPSCEAPAWHPAPVQYVRLAFEEAARHFVSFMQHLLEEMRTNR
jgi:hypothetical protein